jgi:hypothetical protein
LAQLRPGYFKPSEIKLYPSSNPILHYIAALDSPTQSHQPAMSARTIIDVPPWTFQVRIAQCGISFLVLIVTIIPIALWSGYYSFGLGIFTCLATAAITGYWYHANKRNGTAYNRWAILFLDCWATLWWLASFSTLANLAAAFGTIAGLETAVGLPLPSNIQTSRALTGLAAFLGAVEL